MNHRINYFIRQLGKMPKMENINNLYDYKVSDNKDRRHNLRVYLNKMYHLNPKVLLVGEAPGYKGCNVTGVPFTSEKIVKEHFFFKDDNYKITNPKLQSESTATIMWSILDELQTYPLFWNAFPFHPYLENNPFSNRKPNVRELELGRLILKKLIRLYRIEILICVGKVAYKNCLKMNLDLPLHCVRHPSYGGKKDFKLGLLQVMKNLYDLSNISIR